MKKAIIKLELEYEYFDEIGIDDIIQEVENVNLPKEYKEDSFEWVGIELSDGEFINPNEFDLETKGER
tara:strand:- start:750 stop:953 length:204 start_codon:yes stop_codon:yes gene_type:complete